MWRFVLDYWILVVPLAVTADLVWILARGYTTKKAGGVEAVRAENPARYWLTVTLATLFSAWLWFFCWPR